MIYLWCTYFTHREQDVWSVYLSCMSADQGGPEQEWEVGDFKAQGDFFFSFPSSVTVSPTASGCN